MNKKLIFILIAVVVVVGGFYAFNGYIYNEKQAKGTQDYREAEYIIEGQRIKLGTEGTKYFGNEIKTDLDGDGKEDVAFLITQQTGGSGTFYYVVAALNTDNGYVGSEGLFLGDRIAPQTTEISQNPRHKYVFVVNYADRAAGEPMTTAPSVGKSIYLKLDPTTMQFGQVEPNFEGESN